MKKVYNLLGITIIGAVLLAGCAEPQVTTYNLPFKFFLKEDKTVICEHHKYTLHKDGQSIIRHETEEKIYVIKIEDSVSKKETILHLNGTVDFIIRGEEIYYKDENYQKKFSRCK